MPNCWALISETAIIARLLFLDPVQGSKPIHWNIPPPPVIMTYIHDGGVGVRCHSLQLGDAAAAEHDISSTASVTSLSSPDQCCVLYGYTGAS